VILTVVGLGRAGLPLAVQYAEGGHRVCGADVDPQVVDQVNRSITPFPAEAQLAERLAAVVGTGRLTATTDTSAAVAGSDAVVVVVPFTVDTDGLPDFAALDAATFDIGRGLHPDTLVSYQMTLPIGTTRGRWKALLEEVSGLREGQDFSVLEADLHPLLRSAPPATGPDPNEKVQIRNLSGVR
jgi:UDP-N-acetyl-D-mannosaminuronate dehydrogenase